MKLTRLSLFSRKLHTMELPITDKALEDYYQSNANIQDVFPHLTAAQREFIMTGVTPEEWAAYLALAGEDDEDEPSEVEGKEAAGGSEVAMKTTYYCPRGCNIFETASEHPPECASCGQIMLSDPEPFHDAHERRELEGIAERARKLKEGKEPV